MPQMAPLSWILLFLYFLILYVINIILNYFNVLYYPSFKMKSFPQKKFNWKW
uniref:ATP synthase complex subunit 8 n=1 Tax=Curculionoidea sp. 16 KM-2017 TaxID=2219399 RepID=A0A346RK51_9CUCU|nr:ATP synthase F0 subunit 8 [Curculionoidea sp. 16 KM-2017]